MVITAGPGLFDGPVSAFSKVLIAKCEGRVTQEEDRVNLKRDIGDETCGRASLEKTFCMWLAMNGCWICSGLVDGREKLTRRNATLE